MFEQLEVNIASVVIGALLFIISMAWIEFFKALSDKVYFDDHQEGVRYKHELKKKLISVIFTTLLSVVIIIIVYTIYIQHECR